MRRRDRGAERAQGGGNAAHRGQTVSAAGGTGRDFPLRVQMNVRRQVVGVGDDISDMFFGLDSELLHGGVNLPEVVDAGGGLGFGAGAKQIGDHNAANNAMMAITIMISTSVNPPKPFGRVVFIVCFWFLTRRELPTSGFNDDRFVHRLLVGSA